ncbi:hypothetical protein AJ88_01765 [Mesorhizobium amorphae CCBAU 01583]|nr:hypothetical protein AJ88_01765 [Mesorhizobium amorphae CCBAU 01583]
MGPAHQFLEAGQESARSKQQVGPLAKPNASFPFGDSMGEQIFPEREVQQAANREQDLER